MTHMRRVERDRKLLKDIQLYAEVAIVNPRKAQYQVQRILRAALELARRDDMNKVRREALRLVLIECFVDPTDTVEFDGRMLYVNGTFDSVELAKRFIW